MSQNRSYYNSIVTKCFRYFNEMLRFITQAVTFYVCLQFCISHNSVIVSDIQPPKKNSKISEKLMQKQSLIYEIHIHLKNNFLFDC